MSKFILSVVAAGLSFGVAVAGPGGKGSGGGHSSFPSSGSHMSSYHPSSYHTTSNYHSSNSHWGWGNSNYKSFPSNFSGKSFSHGYYFGKSWNQWSYKCWWPKYGCNCYWCPYTSCYYYWCEPSCCYYPISYVQYAPPTQVQVQVTNVTPAPIPTPAPTPGPALQTQTQTQTQGAPPAGIPPLPQ
jgi:hypothetical protein